MIKIIVHLCLTILLSGFFYITAWGQAVPQDTSRKSIYRHWEQTIKEPETRVQLYSKAIDSLEDDWALYYRGQAYLEMGRHELAERDFWAAIRFPKRTLHLAWPYVRIAQRYYNVGDYKMALRMAEKSIEYNDAMALSWRIRSRCYLKTGKIDSAQTSLNIAIQLEPENKDNIWERSSIAMLKEDYHAALNDISLMLSQDPNDARYKARKAWCLYHLDDTEASLALIPELKHLKLLEPDDNRLLGDIMYLHAEPQSGEEYYTHAIEYYEQQMRQDGGYAMRNQDVIYEAYIGRGMTRHELGKVQEALSDYNKAVIIQPKNYRTFLRIGELQTFQGNYRDAISAYDQVHRLYPECREGWQNLGFCYDRLGRYKEAIIVFSKGIQLDSGNCMLYNNRGFTRLTLRQMDLALTDLTLAHSLCPEQIMPLVSLGEYYILIEQYDLAIEYLNRALSIPDGSDYAMATGYYARGKAYLQKREFTKALQDLQKAIKLAPNEPDIWENLAITCFRMEKFCDALQYFRVAISKDGGNEPKKAPNSAYYISIIHDIVVKGCP